MKNKTQVLKISWNDTKVFSPRNAEVRISQMQTTGVLEVENKNFYIIRDPKTINTKTKKKHPEQQPTFYFIPKGMVVKVTKIK
jgi:hypothetical protein